MPGQIDISGVFRHASTEAASARVSAMNWILDQNLLNCVIRFMSDKIMPLSEALHGYELFDKMKVQKGKTAA